jgi:hypothetical protein
MQQPMTIFAVLPPIEKDETIPKAYASGFEKRQPREMGLPMLSLA